MHRFLQDEEIKGEEKQNSPWVKQWKEGDGGRCFPSNTMLVFDKTQVRES